LHPGGSNFLKKIIFYRKFSENWGKLSIILRKGRGRGGVEERGEAKYT